MIVRAQSQDQLAIQWLYEQYVQRVYNLALHLLCHRADAQDVMQDAFIKCFKSLHQYRGDAVFWGWLRKIVTTTAFMHMRSDKRRGHQLAIDDALTEPPLVSADKTSESSVQPELEAALAQLPDTSRAVVWLYHVEGYTHVEIAELMNKSVSFSKTRLARAQKQLRVLLSTQSTPVNQLSSSFASSPNDQTKTNSVAFGHAITATQFEVNQ